MPPRLAICEQALGADHPNVRVVRGNLADLLNKIGRQDEAEALRGRVRVVRSLLRLVRSLGLTSQS